MSVAHRGHAPVTIMAPNAQQIAPAAGSPAAIDHWDAAGALRLGGLTAVLLVFGFGAWAGFAPLSGAVIASGALRVETNRQVVQHLDGGVVKEILVREGDRVGNGDPLLRLDDTRIAAELAIVENRLHDTLARIGRLAAQQADAPEPNFSPDLIAAAASRPDIAALLEGQRQLHRARLDTAAREIEQLRERQAQISDEIAGSAAQLDSLTRQLDLIEQEWRDQRSLLDRGLTQTSRVLALEREKANLQGMVGALMAQMAQARGRITEIEIQLVGRETARREEATSLLPDLRATEAELRERRLALQDQLRRMEIRAPRAGEVMGMTVFAEGAVVRAAEPLLYIVPTESKLVIDASIEPARIDQVYPGQHARLRFSAFNARTTPEIDGSLTRVSADAFVDSATGQSFFAAEIAISDEGLAALGDLTLLPGMPVEVFLQTGERTPMSYFLQPFSDFLSRAMRED